MKVHLIDPGTGLQKRVGIGFHWPLFLLAAAFGLLVVGAAALALGNTRRAPSLLGAAAVVLADVVARSANGARGRRLLMAGWRFADPASLEARMARTAWQIPDLTIVPGSGARPAAQGVQSTQGAPHQVFMLDGGAFLAACTPEAAATSPLPAAPAFLVPPQPQGSTVKVQLLNPRTGELTAIKVGWSWTLFFFSGFFGIPLLLRKLYVWAALFIGINIVSSFGFNDLELETDEMVMVLLINYTLWLPLLIFIAIKGNELTAKNLLDKGWTFANPEGLEAQYARSKWKIAAVAKRETGQVA